MPELFLILQIVSTLMLCGIIWIIQLVQYPFFACVGNEDFPKYHAAHTFWVTPVVAPLMIVELITSVLIIFYPPPGIDIKLFYFGLILTFGIWASTFFLQVPMHNKLTAGFDSAAHKFLVKSNWLRTSGWTLRAGLMIYLVWNVVSF